MQATRVVVPRPPTTRTGSTAEDFREGLIGPVRRFTTEAGALFSFSARAIWELRGVWRSTGEVLRQVGILIIGSAIVMWAGVFLFSMQCGMESNYILRSFGASSYAGAVTAVCHMKMMTALLLAWFFAAKVGAGLAAEIGSMRINDELSAMEALGVNPMRHVIATRLAAVLIALPLIWFIALGVAYVGYITFVSALGDLSLGAFNAVHWQFQSVRDVVFATVLAMAQVVIVTLTALYYGYTARGGPIGVGQATATAMTVNLIVPLLAQAVLGAIFWGPEYHAPIGG